MKINFTQLFVDSWNFVRNKPKFLLQFSLLFTVETIVASYLLVNAIPENLTSISLNQLDINSIHLPSQIYLLIFLHFLCNLFLFSWAILDIYLFSYNQSLSINQKIQRILQRLPGLFAIIILIILPLIVSILEVSLAAFTHSNLSFVSILSFILGIVIFVRFCLTFVDYLVRNISIFQCLQQQWRQGIKNSSNLFLFCLINYFFFSFVMQLIMSLSNGSTFMEVVLHLICSAIYVFSIIFTYRFYSIFMQNGGK